MSGDPQSKRSSWTYKYRCTAWPWNWIVDK